MLAGDEIGRQTMRNQSKPNATLELLRLLLLLPRFAAASLRFCALWQ
jgi:hypothetical protein